MERRTGSCSVEALVVDIVVLVDGWQDRTVGLEESGDRGILGMIFFLISCLLEIAIRDFGWVPCRWCARIHG